MAQTSAAAKARLAHVRERELRSERTWRGLAEQARKTIEEREKAERIRADRRAAQSGAR